MVRIIKTELEYFKNVQYGEIKYMNYGCVEKNASIEKNDIVGIYGQNGSGKTAMIEALDILRCVLSGLAIEYSEVEWLIDDDKRTKMTTTFFVQKNGKKYKVQYSFGLVKSVSDKSIQIVHEELVYWRRGKTWKTRRAFSFENKYYNTEAILFESPATFESDHLKAFPNMNFLSQANQAQKLAIVCAQKKTSVFFNDLLIATIKNSENEYEEEETIFSDIINSLFDFGRLYFQVVKVNQLGAINNNRVIPVNIHSETGNIIMQGCLPMFMTGHADIDEDMYNQLCHATEAINIALKAIIPNLQIEIQKTSDEINDEGKRIIQIDVYSLRNEKRFLTKYESEGIKRIVSLLNYLIAFYNSPEICLVVDELDAGIFEYLLGEILGVLNQEAKGQLIFTSHNLRILEKLDNTNIVCSTINPNNRYIRLKGIEKNNNKRDFYIRSIVVGGQNEELYDDTDLQSIGYAFRKASRKDAKSKLKFSSQIQELLNKHSEDD